MQSEVPIKRTNFSLETSEKLLSLGNEVQEYFWLLRYPSCRLQLKISKLAQSLILLALHMELNEYKAAVHEPLKLGAANM